MTRRFSRKLELNRLRQRLERFGWPRLEMTLLVMLTGLGGFFVSALLLHLNWLTLWSRWLAALAAAYTLFLCLLGCWLHWRGDVDDADASDLLPNDIGHHHDAIAGAGDGGQSAGGGASVAFDGDASSVDVTPDASGAFDGIGDGVGNAAGSLFDADEAAIPLALIAIALAIAGSLLFASVWLVASAPTLFAEVMLDALLAAGLYRRLRARADSHWLETALRRTWLPFLVTAAVLVTAGFLIQHAAPQAHSLGEALALWRA